MNSAIEEMIAADRRRQPELWAKVDRVAALVDPGAFPIGEVVIEPPEAAERYRVRLAYMQAAAPTDRPFCVGPGCRCEDEPPDVAHRYNQALARRAQQPPRGAVGW